MHGKVLVNYWPNSPKHRAQAAGQTSIERCMPAQVIEMAQAESAAPEVFYTIFGRPASKEEFDATPLPESFTEGPPWSNIALTEEDRRALTLPNVPELPKHPDDRAWTPAEYETILNYAQSCAVLGFDAGAVFTKRNP